MKKIVHSIDIRTYLLMEGQRLMESNLIGFADGTVLAMNSGPVYLVPDKSKLYTILGIADELTEEQAAEMLHVNSTREGRSYHWDDTVLYHAWFNHADTALEYLLATHDLTPEKTVILQKQ
jgi:hypothetical protein